MSDRIGQIKYRELESILRSGGAVYLGEGGRKGHHQWGYEVNGALIPVVIPAHRPGAEVKPVYIQVIRRAWKLGERDGITNEDFKRGRWKRD